MISLRIPQSIKRLLTFCIYTSLITGCTFFVLNTWITIEGDFGPEKHPWQFFSLKLHAFSAFAMMLLYGAFLGSHVPLAWRSKHSRKSGISLGVFIGVQVLSAYGLYYLANEIARNLVAWTHLAIGMSLPIALFVHIKAAQKRRFEKAVLQTR